MAGDAEGFGRSLASVPQDVGPHVAADGVVEVAVCRRRLAQGWCPVICRNQSLSSRNDRQHSIVNAGNVEHKASQAIVFETDLW